MQVKGLMKLLKKLPPEAVIRMARDPEGNSIYDIDSLDKWAMIISPPMYVLCPNESKDYVEEDEALLNALPAEEKKAILAKAYKDAGLTK